MAKKDKIEASQKAKAATQATTPEVKVEATAVINFESAKVGDRFWQVSGTDYFCRNKEELKDLRCMLNARAGVNEFECDAAGDPMTPIKDWPYKITKGPDHPRLNG